MNKEVRISIEETAVPQVGLNTKKHAKWSIALRLFMFMALITTFAFMVPDAAKAEGEPHPVAVYVFDKLDAYVELVPGQHIKAGVEVLMSDGTWRYPRNETIEFISSDYNVCHVAQDGELIGMDHGLVTITVNVKTFNISGSFRVYSQKYYGISIVCPDQYLGNSYFGYPNERKYYKVYARLYNGGSDDITSLCTYSVDDPDLVNISQGGYITVSFKNYYSSTYLRVSWKGMTASQYMYINSRWIRYECDDITLSPGMPLRLAPRLYSRNGYHFIAADDLSQYSSSNPAVATVDSKGVVTGKSLGTAEITLKAPEGHETKVTVTVNNIKPRYIYLDFLDDLSEEDKYKISLGYPHRLFKVFAYMEDGSTRDVTATCTYEFSSDQYLTWGFVNWERKLEAQTLPYMNIRYFDVVAKAAGNTMMTIRYMDLFPPTFYFKVIANIDRLYIEPNPLCLYLTDPTRQLKVTAYLSDGTVYNVTNDCDYYISKGGNIATVTQSGLVTATSSGTAEVTVEYKGPLNVTGGQLKHTGTIYVAGIETNPSRITVKKGFTGAFSVIYRPWGGGKEDVTKSSFLSCTSSNPDVARVDTGGQITGVSPGSAVLTFKYYDMTTTMEVTVVDITRFWSNPVSVNIDNGSTKPIYIFAVYGDNLEESEVTSLCSYTSSDTNIATVNANGVVTGVYPGNAAITATFLDKSVVIPVKVNATLDHITVAPKEVTLSKNAVCQLAVTAYYTDNTSVNIVPTRVSHYSGNNVVADVSSIGLITGFAPGSATIRVCYGGKEDTMTVNVIDKEAVLPTLESDLAIYDQSNIGGYHTDIPVTVTSSVNTLAEIKNGVNVLNRGTDYTVEGNTVTLRMNYLNTLENRKTTKLTFYFTTNDSETTTAEFRVQKFNTDLKFTTNFVAVDAEGNYYITDAVYHRILMVPVKDQTRFGVSMTAGKYYLIAGNGQGDYTGNEGPAVLAGVSPTYVVVDNAGNLFFSEYNVVRVVAAVDGTIFGIPVKTGHVYTIAGSKGTGEYYGDGVPASQSKFVYACELALDADGNLYIADYSSFRVRMIAAKDQTKWGVPMTAGYIYTIAGNGTMIDSGDGDIATNVGLNCPSAIAVDKDGNINIGTLSSIRKVDATTGIIKSLVKFTSGYSGDGGNVSQAKFNHIKCLALDQIGNLYIADCNNNAIRMVSAVTGKQRGIDMVKEYVYTIAADMFNPVGVSLDSDAICILPMIVNKDLW
ncbi:Ig-like domain-containing protein [Syntrophomonas palmitatica]|uniref:Ig-like domain-containing protein n=1 Tax=Syntrophomonas palmitatica TaxID=402877 RepID=UPI0006CF64C9|nr:Ig-like domain-containing protein [Syntrophomonas palmitatica]